MGRHDGIELGCLDGWEVGKEVGKEEGIVVGSLVG